MVRYVEFFIATSNAAHQLEDKFSDLKNSYQQSLEKSKNGEPEVEYDEEDGYKDEEPKSEAKNLVSFLRQHSDEFISLLDLSFELDPLKQFNSYEIQEDMFEDSDNFSIQEFQQLFRLLGKIAMGFESQDPEPSALEIIRVRFKRTYAQLLDASPDNWIEINNEKLLRIRKLEQLIELVEQQCYYHQNNYGDHFKRVSGLFPIKESAVTRISKSDYYYFKFLQKTQQSFSIGDLEHIFSRLKVFGHVNLLERLEVIPGASYQENKDKLVEFLTTNEVELHEIFESMLPKNEENMCLSDSYNCLRTMLSIGKGVYVYESRAETEEMFSKVNSLKRFLQYSKQFYFDYICVDKKVYPNINFVSIGYDALWELFDFIMQQNGEMYIEYQSENNKSNLSELRNNLKYTIDRYKEKMKSCNSDLEKKIVSNTIANLKKQLNSLEKKLSQLNDEENIEERREEVLKEIFNFYCKQHIRMGQVNNSFADLEFQVNHISVSDWMCLCRDFKVRSGHVNQRV